MCSVAPFAFPGLAGVPPRDAHPTMATYAEGVPAATWCGYEDDDSYIGALLRGIDAVVRQPKPAGLPMPPMDFLARTRRHDDHGSDFRTMLSGIQSVRVPSGGLMSSLPMDADDDTPTTPVAVLEAPRSYGDDDAALQGDAITSINTTSAKKQQQECGAEYDADIDAAYRIMETDPGERPSEDYLSRTQDGGMMMSDRAELIEKMHRFTTYYELAPGTLHRAVSFVDRFLSARKIHGGDRQLRLLGATAVFAAAKYEDRTTSWRINADAVAVYAGCTRSEVLDAERELVAALGYRLSGPTAYMFVEHFTRNTGEEDNDGAATCRSLAHRLANLALLDYRCLGMLPSVVAASAIMLAKMTLNPMASWREDLEATGYALKDLDECMDAIREMHELQGVWPGCAQMMEGFVLR